MGCRIPTSWRGFGNGCDQDGEPEGAPTNTTLILVQNWFEELKRLAPTD